MPRAPRYSATRRPFGSLAGGCDLPAGAVRSSRMPICESRPDSRARWMASGSLVASPSSVRASSRRRSGVFTSVRSWRCTSNHSRNPHVVEMLGAAHSRRKALEPSARCCSRRWFHRFSRVRKSLVGSTNRACRRSASSRRSSAARARPGWSCPRRSRARRASRCRRTGPTGFDQHACEPRIDRHARDVATRAGEVRGTVAAGRLDRSELGEQVRTRPSRRGSRVG